MSNGAGNMIESSRIAKEAWNKEKVISEKDHSFGGAILIWRTLHRVCVSAKQRLEAQIAENNATFARDRADEKNTVLRSEYRDLISAYQRKFTEYVNMVCDEKSAEVDKLISKTGNPDLISLIQTLSLRKEVSDREWFSIVTRVNESHDFQAAKLLAEVAEKFNRAYIVPFDPEERIAEIEEARSDLLGIANSLDKNDDDLSIKELGITGEYPEPTKMQQQYNKLDTAVGVAVPKQTANLIDRLKKARDVAWSNGDNSTANQITRFLYDRSEYVESRQVVASYYREEAESLIRKALDPKNSSDQAFNNLVNYFDPHQR